MFGVTSAADPGVATTDSSPQQEQGQLAQVAHTPHHPVAIFDLHINASASSTQTTSPYGQAVGVVQALAVLCRIKPGHRDDVANSTHLCQLAQLRPVRSHCAAEFLQHPLMIDCQRNYSRYILYCTSLRCQLHCLSSWGLEEPFQEASGGSTGHG